MYDASPEHAHFESPILTNKARTLGKALGKFGLGIVARIGSPIVAAALDALSDATAASVVLSPAATPTEHERAYRLPKVSHPLIYTGRGSLGTDSIAIHSASAVLIFGSYPRTLENIIECVGDTMIPVGVLTDEDTSDVHERVRTLSPRLTAQLFVSHDPHVLVRELADELRRRAFETKLSQ